jgi:hypothetical protein
VLDDDDDSGSWDGPWFAQAVVLHGPVVVGGRVARALVAVPVAGRGRAAVVSVEVWCGHGRWACGDGPPELPDVLAPPPAAWSALEGLGVTEDPFPPDRWEPLAACPVCAGSVSPDAEPGTAADAGGTTAFADV